MVVDANATPMNPYVTNEAFARKVNSLTFYDATLKAWFAYPITR